MVSQRLSYKRLINLLSRLSPARICKYPIFKTNRIILSFSIWDIVYSFDYSPLLLRCVLLNYWPSRRRVFKADMIWCGASCDGNMEHGSQHPYRTLTPLSAPLHRSSRGSGPHTSLVRVYCSNLCAASHNRILVRISSWRHVWMAGSLDQFIRRSRDPAQGRHTTKGAVRNVRSFGSRATQSIG